MKPLAWWVLLGAVFLIACGRGGSGEEQQDPARLLREAQAAVARVSSFSFKLSHENGTTPLPLNLNLISAEGEVAIPDRLAADVQARTVPLNVSVKVIGIGESLWITNPFTRRWELLPGASARDFADPAALMSSAVAAMRDVAYAGKAEVNGVRTHHLRGTLDSAVLAEKTSLAEPGFTLTVDVWLGQGDLLPRRLRLAGRLTAREAENIVRQVDFSRFNAAVDIRPPQ